MILLFDNYDSFTYNLLDLFHQSGVEIKVVRNNELSLSEIIASNPEAIVISPGPGRPEQSGILMELVEHFHNKVPMLGVCLGLQAIALYFGGKLKHAIKPMHGKTSEIYFETHAMFEGIPPKSKMMRYHSLIAEELPSSLKIIGKSAEGEIMAIAHDNLKIWAVQFHPESILSEYGPKIVENWLTHFQLISRIN